MNKKRSIMTKYCSISRFPAQCLVLVNFFRCFLCLFTEDTMRQTRFIFLTIRTLRTYSSVCVCECACACVCMRDWESQRFKMVDYFVFYFYHFYLHPAQLCSRSKTQKYINKLLTFKRLHDTTNCYILSATSTSFSSCLTCI